MRDIKRLEPLAVLLSRVTIGLPSSGAPVLSDISLEIPAGQWLGVTGMNGSGKSTLLRLISGLLLADEGSVTINGLTLAEDTVWEVRKEIGFVFASPDNQFVGQTVAEDIAFGMANRCLEPEAIRSRIHQYAELLSITDLLGRHPSSLSGGQKQRVAIASVLAMEPRIILFDEATSMLDESSRREVLGIMKQLQAVNRYTLISVTHDTDELLEAERIIMLADGSVIGDGIPEELLIRDEWRRKCRLQTPYMLQLCRDLQRQGIGIGERFTEEEVQKELWAFISKTSLTTTRMASYSRG
ncbi:ATP-binding cassette domain-containing protein [Paenibacillus sp. PAMC21692]|uniref:ATP-binding cassette domain-containing protein n=1 Tax=Paenibacillus sp. PAMC21692 TaxID=2762320 RepID=UPI00164D43D3|nr:ATP-binding cassette domain-containing protein [Paenibacillus sp. PAMC21692]QNK58691.1 ATP-binding cassette domain-containing protein [Paenibacillus sp. PAMC21692]